jgi:hypothetical protein
MPVLIQEYIYRKDLKEHPEFLYLFGDNAARFGLGGQAKEMRGEPNAVGIRTKWTPHTNNKAYFNDKDYDKIVKMLNDDFEIPFQYIELGGTVVIPKYGLGSGLSKLPELAPKCNAYLQDLLIHLISQAGPAL